MTVSGLLLLAVQAAAAMGDLSDANSRGAISALSKAQANVDLIGHCAEAHPRRDDWEGRYQAVFPLLAKAAAEAEGLYPGIDILGSALSLETPVGALRCTAQAIRFHESLARQALGEVNRLMRIDSAPRDKGLWFGNLRLCGERVAGIESSQDPIADRRINIRFSDAFAPRMEALTRARLGRPIPVIIDGSEVARPVVLELIRHEVSVNFPQEVSTERLLRETSSAC